MIDMILIPPPIRRLYKLLPSLYRRKLLSAGGCVFLMAVSDLLGVGLLLPVLLLVLNENALESNAYISTVYAWGGFDSYQSFTYAICGLVLLVSFVRVLFSSYLQYTQNKRLFNISSYLSMWLYRIYYEKGFLYIKRNNSLQLINNVNSVAVNLISGYFIPFTSLICEVIVIISILVSLILFNVYVFLLVLLTFVPISLIYYRFSRSRIQRYGARLFELYPLRGKLLQQTFIGYGDMEMSNSFPICVDRFKRLLQEQNSLSVKNAVLNSSLQRVLELAIICSVIVLVIATQLFSLPALGIIIGLFAIAVYRVLPGIVKSTGYVFTMRSNIFALGLLDELEAEPSEQQRIVPQKIAFRQQICFDAVSFSYEENVPVFHNFSLEIQKGDFVGIRGESGSGKSTLFHLLLGFLKPDSGTIWVDGISLSPEVMADWHAKVGYVSQQLFMMEGTLLENIVMGIDVEPDRKRVLQVLRQASLDTFISGLPDGIDTLVGEGGCLLSGGQRQRLGIARALYKEVEVLLFDEATSSLDVVTEQAINDAIVHLSEERADLTLLVISHRQESLAICRRIVNIEALPKNQPLYKGEE